MNLEALPAKLGLAYHLSREEYTLGETSLTLHTIANIDEAIEQMFAELARRGEPDMLDELCPFFGIFWGSGRALAEEIAKLKNLSGMKILEIGCGLAVPSMIAAKLGANVLASDFHPDVPTFLQKNLNANGINIEYDNIDWHQTTRTDTFDMIIGSDILYEKRQVDILPPFIAARLNPGGRAIITDPGRAYLQDFQNNIRSLGFSCDVDVVRVNDNPGTRDIFVLTIQKKFT